MRLRFTSSSLSLVSTRMSRSSNQAVSKNLSRKSEKQMYTITSLLCK